MARDELPDDLAGLIRSQSLAVLSTHQGGQPYASLVAYAAADDLRCLWFATPRTTRKYANLMADVRAAMLIDSRSHRVEDFHRAMACTALGTVRELDRDARVEAEEAYLRKLPHLGSFIHAPTCALVELAVARYVVVSRFQSVTEYLIR